MSTIKANDIQNASGGIPTVKGQRLIPTAWVNFNGTGTVAIRDSENVSSITDNGLGLYSINFATAMDTANYSVVLTTSRLSSYDETSSAYTYTTTSVAMHNVTGGGTFYDTPLVSAVFLGGQA